ncbi:putative bZIP transcription factor (MetR) [Aspergillus lucknowensis]|uniref:BZIP domain-containing protein n=1 Tax=Aspergillus lucknowensis TaxID=176173 RepID=A0ABR4LVN1_9EURO
MAEYNGRRAPNFSQYLEDLNAIPSPYDIAMQQQQQEAFNLDSELSLFTNTEFFDFDKLGDLNIPQFDQPVEENKQNVTQSPDMEFLDMLGDGFGKINEFAAPQMNQMNNSHIPVQNSQFHAVPQSQVPNQLPNVPVPMKSSPTSPTTSSPSQHSAAASSPTTATPPAASAPEPKRKNTQKAPVMSVEEAARVAAEEDKRRRNTAASARFRVKKKMREQALEKTVKDTTEKNAALEARVTALELENQWLKNLITEKNGKSAEESKKAQNDITDMFKKFLAAQKTEGERSSTGSKIGVGTL